MRLDFIVAYRTQVRNRKERESTFGVNKLLSKQLGEGGLNRKLIAKQNPSTFEV